MRRVLKSLLLVGAVGALVALSAVPASAGPVSGPNPIKNIGTNRCLQPQGGSAAEFAAVTAEPCNGSPQQQWQYEKIRDNRYHLISSFSHLCLNVFGPTATGTPILLVNCVTVSNEEFNTQKALPDLVTLMSRAGNKDTNFCADIQSPVGATLLLKPCGSVAALSQTFTVGLPVTTFARG